METATSLAGCLQKCPVDCGALLPGVDGADEKVPRKHALKVEQLLGAEWTAIRGRAEKSVKALLVSRR